MGPLGGLLAAQHFGTRGRELPADLRRTPGQTARRSAASLAAATAGARAVEGASEEEPVTEEPEAGAMVIAPEAFVAGARAEPQPRRDKQAILSSFRNSWKLLIWACLAPAATPEGALL